MGLTCFTLALLLCKKRRNMKKFQTMQELLAYMAGIEIPNELKNAVAKNMQAVEECNNGGATAYLGVTKKINTHH